MSQAAAHSAAMLVGVVVVVVVVVKRSTHVILPKLTELAVELADVLIEVEPVEDKVLL
jgi:hypothetical protein